MTINCIKTNIPNPILDQILQTNSSPEVIVMLLNETENKYFLKPRHFNSKRIYPFWKVCLTCHKPFQTFTKEQAQRNKNCSKCSRDIMGKWNKGKYRTPEVVCGYCGKRFRPKWRSKKNPTKFCSHSCNGKVRSLHLIKFSGNGKGKKRPNTGLKGSLNPAWKGGVTYFRKRGNYLPIKYVRCPKEFLVMARKDGYVMEHRLIMAKKIGRPLTRIETVHHIDHNPQNNDAINLMLFKNNSEHKLYESQEQRFLKSNKNV